MRFGSVFLFKNGFRVAPYGDEGDDSLGLDKRKAQGYARYLGSRELIGMIQIWASDEVDFKEVASREGGLRKTQAYKQLVDSVVKTLRLLEKYVVNVAWVLEKEKDDTDDLKYIDTDNGKEKIISMISTMTKSKHLALLEFNKDFLNIINERLDQQSSEILDKLQALAKKQGDEEFSGEIDEINKKVQQLEKEKQIAELNAANADEARAKAEEATSKTREEKEDALKQARAEKVARQQTEQTLAQNKEKVASLEQVNYFQEEQIDRLSSFTKSDVISLIGHLHHIGIYSDAIEKNMANIGGLFRSLPSDVKEILTDIDFDAKKISVLSRLGQRAFGELDDTAEFDLIQYTNQYVEKILRGTISGSASINLTNNTGQESFFIKGNPTDISVIIDNLINNSEKANSTKISISFEKRNDRLELKYQDNGIGLSPNIKDPNKIFELGFTTTMGSGIGLNHITRIIDEIGGKISVNSDVKQGFELIFSFGDIT